MEDSVVNPEFWAAIIGQTIILVVTIVAATIRTERRITRVETKVEHLEDIKDKHNDEHGKIDAQMQGISRAVATLQGENHPRSRSGP